MLAWNANGEHDDELRRLYVDEQMSIRDIMQQLGIAHGTVHSHLSRLGILRKKENGSGWDKEGKHNDTIREMYVVQCLSPQFIADYFNVDRPIIVRRLDMMGVHRRTQTEAGLNRRWNGDGQYDDKMRELYCINWMTVNEIAEHYNISNPTAERNLQRLGITTHRKPVGPRKGEDRRYCGDYVIVRIKKTDPFRVMARNGWWVPEHRLVVARDIGRALESWEIVHHKNGVKDDNRIENLELISRSAEHFATVRAQQEWRKLQDANAKLRAEVEALKRENEILRKHQSTAACQ